ncbi:hypothetical protein HHL22_22185 [Hymenobacter sp. RP-2-7]|uniref:Band 7 domain-containing protein n=1 Tax=Hymenobacter polaris TaxID=2682546 RepID=A0A7Y0FQ01_9BACT|nr:hypothetical protein [Hymenobacter polaris]NML67919.1 hypothetical protein [Hymenobacter polaris]
MNITYPTAVRPSVTVTSSSGNEPAINKITLVVCGVLFFCTFPYWFGDTSSKASLVNVLLMRNGLLNETLSFWGHLLLTVGWLYLFYKGGASEWVGWRISSTRQITRLFYHSQKPATWGLRAILGLLLVLLAYKLYSALLGFAEGSELPRAQVLSVLLLIALLLLLWNVRYINPQPLQTTGFIAGRNRPLWVNISPTQLVYVAQFSGGMQTWVRHPAGFADISYTDVYAFDIKSLSHKLHNARTAQSIMGDIRYNLTLRPIFSSFPTHLTDTQIQNIQARLGANVDITTEISAAFDRQALIDSVTSRYFNAVSDVYTKSGATVFDDVNREVFSNFDKLKTSINFAGLEEDCQNRIKQHLARITTIEDAFDVAEFIIVDVQFSEGEIKNMLNDVRERAMVLANGRTIIEQEMAKATINDGGQPGVNVVKRAEDRTKGIGILRSNFSSHKQEPKVLSPAEQQTEFKEAVRQGSNKLLNILLDPTQQGPEATSQALLLASPLFTERNISPESFVKRFLQKVEAEKNEPSEEVLRRLVENTLLEFFNESA